MNRPRNGRHERLRAALATRTQQPFVATESIMPASIPVRGRCSRVMLNSGEAVPVRYAVVEADWLVTSHRGLRYQRDERYPAAAQPRDYSAEHELQLAVESRACNLDPLRLLSDSVLPVDGPPIARADGVVLSGNGRTQSICIAAERGLYGEVREGILERASWFRLDTRGIAAMKTPVLVRLMIEDVTEARELARLGLEMNRDPGQGMSSPEQAIALARLVTPAVVARLTELIAELTGDKTVREFMRIRSRDIAVILGHSGLIDSRKRSMYFTEAGELTEAAKQLIETMLAGITVTDIDVLRDASGPTLDRLVRAGIEFARARAAGTEWDLARFNDAAIRLVSEAEANAAYLRSLEPPVGTASDSIVDRLIHLEHYGNVSADFEFSKRHQVHPAAEALARCLELSPGDYVRVLRRFAERASGKWNSIFDCLSPAEVFTETIGRPLKPDGSARWSIPVATALWESA